MKIYVRAETTRPDGRPVTMHRTVEAPDEPTAVLLALRRRKDGGRYFFGDGVKTWTEEACWKEWGPEEYFGAVLVTGPYPGRKETAQGIWMEVEAAARALARQGLTGAQGDPLPNLMGVNACAWISTNQERFRELVAIEALE